MKLIISYSQTKRRIDGPFRICGSREDIESLATQLVRHLEDANWSYGWIGIYGNIPAVLENTPAIEWDA